MIHLRSLLALTVIFGVLIYPSSGQSPTPTAATPRYAALLQGLAAATNARRTLEGQLQTYKRTFDTLKQAEQHDRDNCSCYDSAIAFTAFLDKNIASFGSQQPLPFDNVTLNLGSGYDTRHAAFTAPVDGIYQIFVTIANPAGYKLVVDILHNRTLLTKLRTGNENYYHSATNGVVVRMKKGDDIWVEHDRTTTDSNKLYYQDGMITSFSGYLIHKD